MSEPFIDLDGIQITGVIEPEPESPWAYNQIHHVITTFDENGDVVKTFSVLRERAK